MKQQYWICNAALEHVNIVKKKGYTQINMGPRQPLANMNVGDWILYYSPTINFEDTTPTCQKFTGIAVIRDTKIYPQGNKQPDHWRRNIEFFDCRHHHPQHFFGKVSFLPNDCNWIQTLNQPIFQITRDDFVTIAEKILIPDPTKILLY